LTTKTIQNISLKRLQPNKWNPNVMQETEFKALKEDMKTHEPEEIDSLLVSPYLTFYPCEDTEENRKLYAENPIYVIVDGEHRWNAAIELEWSDIPCEVRELSEEEAKGICYRKNKDRGSIDPFKEAALFKTELELLSQKEIAEKYLVDPSTVSHRLSLLKLVPEVIKQIEKLPRGTITTSHLEPIATLPEAEQKKFALVQPYNKEQTKSVQEIAEAVKRTKAELVEKEALAKALKTAKFKECPKCKAPAGEIYHKGLPWVRCSKTSYDPEHAWNLDTGEPSYKPVVMQESLDEKKKPEVSSVIRSNFTIEQLSEAFFKSIQATLPKLDSASKLSIHGTVEGEEFSLNFEHGPNGMRVAVSQEHEHLNLSAEPKDYKTGHKSKVDIGVYQPKKEDINQHLEFIENAFKNVLIPLPEKKKPAEKVQCVGCDSIIEDMNAVRYKVEGSTEEEIYCGRCAVIRNLPGYETEDEALNSKALKEREQLAKKAAEAAISQDIGQ
jgi:ParB/RepB/Spo0J family partition protein